jgi:acetyl-CoA acetyltransferase
VTKRDGLIDGMRDRAAIAGIGATEFSKASGRSELTLACECVLTALDDCGLPPDAVDGMVCFGAETNREIEIARTLGIGQLSFFSRVGHGGGAACATVMQAALAIATGAAEVVVCYRAFNERSGRRFGAGIQGRAPVATAENAQYAWYSPYGLLTPASWVAMHATRAMHEFGWTSEDFGAVAVADRAHAATNPKAWFYEQRITLADHQASRWIVEPLHLLDCCQETDGGQALVLTSVERARDLPHPVAVVRVAAQGAGPDQESMTSYYRESITGLPEMGLVAQQCWATTGLSAADIQTAVFYDHFTPFVLNQLEEFGFCGRGEAAGFVADAGIGVGGDLPINTHGGQLGEAYLHGMNGIAEAVRQVRGTSVNQLPRVEHVLVTAGTGVPTSACILGADR